MLEKSLKGGDQAAIVFDLLAILSEQKFYEFLFILATQDKGGNT